LEEILVVEGRMIVSSFKYSPFSFEKGSEIYPLAQNGEKTQPKCPVRLLPPLPVDKLAWQILPDKFSARTTRLISSHIADLHCDSLREQVYNISEILANKLQISMTDAELSSIFGLEA
jgi:hypothetical protein